MSEKVALQLRSNPGALGAFLTNKRSAATRAAYRADLLSFVRYLGVDPAAGEEALLTAGVAQVVSWRDAMIEAEAAPATVGRRLSSLRSLFKFAKSIGAIAINAAELVEAPRVEAARQKAPHP